MVTPLDSPTAPAPTISFSGGGGLSGQQGPNYTDMIGDKVNMIITAPYTKQVFSANVNLGNSNAYGSTATQNIVFDNTTATYPILPNPSPVEVDQPQQQQTFQFFWNATPGNFTITVTAYYSADKTLWGQTSFTVNVQAPTIANYKDVYQASQFYSSGANLSLYEVGLGPNNTVVDGNVFSAQITVPDVPGAAGTSGFIQVINFVFAETSNLNKQNTVTFTTKGQMVLDDGTNNQNVWLSQYTPNVGGNATTNIGANGQAHDTPGKMIDTSLFPNGDYVTSIRYHSDVSTYLIYQPANGLAVGIAVIPDWSWTLNVTYNGAGAYNDPKNWATNLIPAAAGTLNGNAAFWTPSWSTDTASIFMPQPGPAT